MANLVVVYKVFVGDNYNDNRLVCSWFVENAIINHNQSSTLRQLGNVILSVYQGNPLHEAARQGNLHTVRHLIDGGMDVNIKDDHGVSLRLRKGLYFDLVWVVSLVLSFAKFYGESLVSAVWIASFSIAAGSAKKSYHLRSQKYWKFGSLERFQRIENTETTKLI